MSISVSAGKLKRKGSRMSMARSLEQQIKRDAKQDDLYELPKFLEKSASHDKLGPSLSATKETTIAEETEDELATEQGNYTEPPPHGGGGGVTGASSGSSDARSPQSRTQDEGLGESFEQASEMSDSGCSMGSARGGPNGAVSLRTPPYDTVPEEDVPAEQNANTNNGNRRLELTLDPARLAAAAEAAAAAMAAAAAKKESCSSAGSGKKVSFFGSSGNSSSEAAENPEVESPVSDTFVYDGKARSRFGFGRRK